MAEGDAIHRLARRLSGRITDKTIVDSDFRTSRLANASVTGAVIGEVVAIGKHLLFRLDTAMTLHSHLRMEGEWAALGTGKVLPTKRADDIRCVLRFGDLTSLWGLSLPVLDLVPTAEEKQVVGHLGPDILATGFDLAEATNRYRDDRRPVIETLLDQRVVCGMGNLWVVEVLFLRGVYPWTPAADVDLEALLRLARKMMLYSLEVQPGMITTGNRTRGETHWVYGRYRRPCRRCGTPVDFRPGGGGPYDRETWWCPHCQPTAPWATFGGCATV